MVRSAPEELAEAYKQTRSDPSFTEEYDNYLRSYVGRPSPLIVRDFQRIFGRVARAQILEIEGRLPEVCIACANGGSNAIGLFYAFRDEPEVRLVGVEAAGEGVETERHAATISKGSFA